MSTIRAGAGDSASFAECGSRDLGQSGLRNCDGGDFVVVKGGDGELQSLLVKAKGRPLSRLEQFDRLYRHSRWKTHGYDLRPEWIHCSQPAMLGGGVGVVEQVNCITGTSFPTKHLQEARALDVNDAFIVADPADGVVQQPKEVAVAGKPVGTLDVSREPHGSA